MKKVENHYKCPYNQLPITTASTLVSVTSAWWSAAHPSLIIVSTDWQNTGWLQSLPLVRQSASIIHNTYNIHHRDAGTQQHINNFYTCYVLLPAFAKNSIIKATRNCNHNLLLIHKSSPLYKVELAPVGIILVHLFICSHCQDLLSFLPALSLRHCSKPLDTSAF